MSRSDIWGFGVVAYITAAAFLFSSLEVPFFKLFTSIFEISYERTYELSYLLSQRYDSILNSISSFQMWFLFTGVATL